MRAASSQLISGAGIGLRSQHHLEILESEPEVAWFEVLSENYFGDGGPAVDCLAKIRSRYPITLHGVGMSLGSIDPLNFDYLSRLKTLVQRFEPEWVSDHLAWISVDGEYVHDLLPLPYTEEAMEHVATRIDQVQDFLGRQILIENPSTYLSFRSSDLTEWEFLAELAARADCGILFDVNNAYVSAFNHGFDARQYLDALPPERVREIHLAGYEEHEDFLFDTHGHRVHEPVWALYRETISRFGERPTLIEWDTDIPSLDLLRDEAAIAQAELDVA